jgi:hypothetical protein
VLHAVYESKFRIERMLETPGGHGDFKVTLMNCNSPSQHRPELEENY